MRRPIQKTEECYMAKKVISFIVILLVFCTAGAAVLIGTSNFGLGFGGMTENPVSSAYALDRAGDIYYVNRTSTGMELVCVDSTGKRLFEKNLTRRFSAVISPFPGFTSSTIREYTSRYTSTTRKRCSSAGSPFRISTRTEPMPGRCSRRRSPA